MEKKELVIIGGSAGSIEVLLKIIPHLPANYALPILIVVHRKLVEGNLLEGVFKSKCTIDVIEAEDKMPLLPSKVYLAPAGYHLLIEKEHTIALDSSEKVKYSRPNIDVSMFSVARVFKNKVVAVLLSGANEDGSLGMKKIHDEGGITIVQTPDTALIPVMPEGVLKLFKPDHVCDPEDIATLLMQFNK